MKLKDLSHIHFSGIKGVGMTALALYAQDMGIEVSGSDVEEEFVTQEILNKRKISVKRGFKESNIPNTAQALIYSAAHSQNPQIRYAKKQRIPNFNYAKALADLTAGKGMIAVCGVGGKTTVASMIATILFKTGADPSFVIGVGNIPDLKTPGRFAKGKHVIVEADDYIAVPGIDNIPKFLYLRPKVIVVTNIEYDHPDVFRNLDETMHAFLTFFKLLPNDGLLVANIDNANIRAAITKLTKKRFLPQIITYGNSPQANWRIDSVKIKKKQTLCSIIVHGIRLDLKMKIPGKFNAENACAALMVATHLGVSQKQAIIILSTFTGTKRRFEKIGEFQGVEIWDDYAHHPSEIQATITAARQWFPEKRLVVVFQPHTYSRTKALLDEFASSLSLADEAIVTEIYSSAREKKDSTISGEILTQKLKKIKKYSRYIPSTAVLEYLGKTIRKEDVVFTMGAGDIYKKAEQLTKK